MQARVSLSRNRFSQMLSPFRPRIVIATVIILFLCLTASTVWTPRAGAQEFPESAKTKFYNRVHHIIVIYQENWSFDSLYPRFPGANGIANAASTTPQVDKSGAPITVLPQPINNNVSPAVPDSRFPANLPVAPYDMTKYVPADQTTG